MELVTVKTDKTGEANGSVKNIGSHPAHDSLDLYYNAATEDTKNLPEEIIPTVFKNLVHENSNFIAFKSKSNPEGGFDLCVSMAEYLDLTKRAARSFIKLGLEPKASVGILGFNHLAWAISQFGCIFAGGMVCGIYATNTADICKYIINNSGCQIIVVENTTQLSKVLSIVPECPQVRAIIQYIGHVSESNRNQTTLPIHTWTEFLDQGSEEQSSELERRLANIKPKDTAILIYTSGTTGLSKGVMLSHDNILWTSNVLLQTIKLKKFEHSVVSYLPFSHIAANLFDLVSTITLGVTVYFAQPDALKGSLAKTLVEVRPSLFLGVPRVFEKIQETMQEVGLRMSFCRRLISRWAKEVGYRNSIAKQSGKSTDVSYAIANCLVFTKVKKLLGLDRCNYVLSGAAPISQQTLDFFQSLDIIIHQVYGMSECSGPHTITYGLKTYTGSVGPLMKGVEMKIADPDSNGVGEICMRGRHVFEGYYRDPGKTSEVLDQEGWLHSGDLGKVESNEFLIITGRIKELIITAGGENVAPVPIEQKIKERLPFLSNVMLIGDRRKFISCLLTLKTTLDFETQRPTSNLTPGAVNGLREVGVEALTVEDVIGSTNPALKTAIDSAIKEVNSTSVSQAAFVQKWSFLDKDFSIPGGELGPTMKLKRPVITEMYADIIERMYM